MGDYPGPIRAGFRRLRLNVSIHWLEPGKVKSPCGSDKPNDVITGQFPEDVTCPKCLEKLRPKKERAP